MNDASLVSPSLGSRATSHNNRQGSSIFGSLPDSSVVSSNSARCHRASTGEKSGLHLLSGRLPRTDVCMSTEAFSHASVMLDEIRQVFTGINQGVFLDATLGAAGHSSALLHDHPKMTLLGLDQDEAALSFATEQLSQFSGRVTLRRARFDHVTEICENENIIELCGALFDLGVSSPQFDVAERGFSYRHDGPLDMRMDRRNELTADIVVNTYEESTLAQIISDYSDERFAQRISRAIVSARPITTTSRLAEVITAAIPAATRRRGGHPAKRAFQAIRIEVNRELEILPVALRSTIELLAPGARLAVLTFHSGEDRIVKSVLREAETGGCNCPSGLPCACGAVQLVKRVRASRTASASELAVNNRASSARLRVVEKVVKA
jgi:16S rRNA (cytosine1402-N4)-methyltransferase